MMAKILVVDDEMSVRELIKEVLSTTPHEVDLVEDGMAAVQAVRKKDYNVMIIDRNMPKMTGLEAVTIIRSNPKYQSLKIIMCTSVSVTQEVDEAFAAGANDYILKPINLKALLAKVEKALLTP